MSEFMIAPKRENRGTVPEDWQQTLLRIPGLALIGGNSRRIQVEATDHAIASATEALGDQFHIEKVTGYDLQDSKHP